MLELCAGLHVNGGNICHIGKITQQNSQCEVLNMVINNDRPWTTVSCHCPRRILM